MIDPINFRRMADHAPAMIWVTSPAGAHTFLSRSWYDFTGQTPDQGLGQGWVLATHPDDRERTLRTFLDANAGREVFRLEYRLRRHDGVYRWMLDAATPHVSSGGTFLGFIGSVIDITERRMTEEQREALLLAERHARTEAERVSRMKDEFLATLSHELRTPLSAILGWSQVLMRGTLTAADARKAVEAIERNARAQTQMIEDLLDVSRIASGKVRLDVRPVNVADIAEQAVQTLLPAATARGVQLVKMLDPRAGPVAGDADRLRQVCWNLLSNAIKFTPRGGRVEIETAHVNSYVELCVKDTGEGIDPTFLPHLFGRFQQYDGSTTRAHGGLGLGLSIVKQLVELHGGTVHASSEGAGRGATFVVELPAGPDAGSRLTNH